MAAALAPPPCSENWQHCEHCGAKPNETCRNPDVSQTTPEPSPLQAGGLPPERGQPSISGHALEAIRFAQQGAVPRLDSGAAAVPAAPPVTVVGLVGHKRVGKDTAARALEEQGFVNLKFAEPLKDMLRVLFKHCGFGPEIIERMIDGDLKEIGIAALGGRSPRYLMETLGTDWGREMVTDDIWVSLTKTKASLAGKAVITDVRFENEVEAVRELGGMLVRIERPSLPKEIGHASTKAIDDLPVFATLHNVADNADGFYRVASTSFQVLGITG